MFYRTQSSDTKGAGTGLGLAICRGIVEAHRGIIHIDAGLHGAGTCVIIRLPPADFAPQVSADEVSTQ
jgi:two-component system sensor histidine kinase KdpD